MAKQGLGRAVAEQSHPERILSQALRAMAGGRPDSPMHPGAGVSHSPAGRGADPAIRLTTVQMLLIAAIVGVVVGMGAGLVMLIVR